MQTQCNPKKLKFQDLNNRKVEADFNGGMITSDAGGLLLREVELGRQIIKRFSECFTDYRKENLTEHSVEELVAQRVYGISLGYDDLNDHERLRTDTHLATLVGKQDPTGQERRRKRDKGKALAGKSTLNRLERTPAEADEQSRYHKIVYDEERMKRCFVDIFLDSYEGKGDWLILDLDVTDNLIHGNQEGRFYHGYYRNYCYLPLYIFCEDHLLCARLRMANKGPVSDSIEELVWIVEMIRSKWPDKGIIIRGDSEFSHDDLMSWCESNGVDYIFGLGRNVRLSRRIQRDMKKMRRKYKVKGEGVRKYRSFRYRTRKSWSRARKVIGKAEYLPKGPNGRFIVTSLDAQFANARDMYEEYYCARGDMENRIKEQQLWLFADRTSCETIRANQLRLWLSSLAYVLIAELRRKGLEGTELEKAQTETIRNKLFKIGAIVKVTVRRVALSFSSAYPFGTLYQKILINLQHSYHF